MFNIILYRRVSIWNKWDKVYEIIGTKVKSLDEIITNNVQLLEQSFISCAIAEEEKIVRIMVWLCILTLHR